MNASKNNRNRVNGDITAPKLRLISEKGEQVGIVNRADALLAAERAKLDLVEIQPNAEPPVARIMDNGKHMFRQSKQKHMAKKKQKKIKLKEIKFRPSTDTADYEVKMRNIRGFLESGDKVKITVWFKGREMMHQNLGRDLLDKIKDELAEESKIEFYPKLEGRQLTMVLVPKKAS